jgi:hypothetical protein
MARKGNPISVQWLFSTNHKDIGQDRLIARDRMRQSLKLSRAFSSSSAGEDFMFQCLFKSLAKAQKDREIWISSEMLKYMGLLPADLSFHYVIHFVNEDNDCIGLGSGESSGSSSLPTTWWEVWFFFHRQNVRRLHHWLILHVQIQCKSY